VQGLSLAGAIAFYLGARQYLRLVAVAPFLSDLLAAAVTLPALIVFRYGMEVTAALPFAVWMLVAFLRPQFQWRPLQVFGAGLLGALTILSRIDAIFLVFPLMFLCLVLRRGSVTVRLIDTGLFLAGLFPFFLYLALNFRYFHLPLPVSGLAKQLKPLWPPTSVPLFALFSPVAVVKLVVIVPAIILLCVAWPLLWRLRHSLEQRQTSAFAALLLFPVLQIGVLCVVSDYGIWPWYYYTFVLSLLASLPLLALTVSTAASAGVTRLFTSAVWGGICAGGLIVLRMTLGPVPPESVAIPKFVAAFTHQHPGIFAMGDAAGTPAYRSDQPFIQLEGLMMDAEYLKLMRQHPPLREVLRHYGVRYYIGFYQSAARGCVMVQEPEQGGAGTPKMRGKICVPPLDEIEIRGRRLGIYNASDVLLP
jgi:hypothetical protein